MCTITAKICQIPRIGNKTHINLTSIIRVRSVDYDVDLNLSDPSHQFDPMCNSDDLNWVSTSIITSASALAN